jgi:hypothetical protein
MFSFAETHVFIRIWMKAAGEMLIHIVIAPGRHDSIVLAVVWFVCFFEDVVGFILRDTETLDAIMHLLIRLLTTNTVSWTERWMAMTAAAVLVKSRKHHALELGIHS